MYCVHLMTISRYFLGMVALLLTAGGAATVSATGTVDGKRKVIKKNIKHRQQKRRDEKRHNFSA